MAMARRPPGAGRQSVGDMSRVLRRDMARYMCGDIRAGSRDVSDPRGRGRERSPGRRGGSLTSRMPQKPGFPAGTARRPAVTDAAGAMAAKVRLLWWLPPDTVSMTCPPDRVIRSSATRDTRTNAPWGFVPLFVRA